MEHSHHEGTAACKKVEKMMCLGNSTHCCISGFCIFWGDEPLVVGCQRIFQLPLPKVLREGRPGLQADGRADCMRLPLQLALSDIAA